jgi:DNA-binding transcriptional LysR family regulator
VREILIKVKATVATKPGFDPASSTRRFSLMMSDYVATVLMNEVLLRTARVAPGVEFEIVSNDVPLPLEALERADVDLLIMPSHFLAKDHPQELLFTDSYACIVWDQGPIGATLSSEEYLRLGHVGVQFDRGRSPVIDEWFLSRLGVSRRVEVFTMSFNTIPQMIVGTDRIATVHRRLAEFYCRYLPLRIIACPFELPAVAEAVQWHKYFDQDPGLAWLRGVLREVGASSAAPSQGGGERR